MVYIDLYTVYLSSASLSPNAIYVCAFGLLEFLWFLEENVGLVGDDFELITEIIKQHPRAEEKMRYMVSGIASERL